MLIVSDYQFILVKNEKIHTKISLCVSRFYKVFTSYIMCEIGLFINKPVCITIPDVLFTTHGVKISGHFNDILCGHGIMVPESFVK